MNQILSRASLQKLAKKQDGELLEEQINDRVENIVQYIMEQVIQRAKNGKTIYTYQPGHHQNKELSMHVEGKRMLCDARGGITGYSPLGVGMNVYQNVILSLGMRLPDCDILTHPQQNYIIVDWS